MLQPYRPQHRTIRTDRCALTIQWRYNGHLYAICRECPWMLHEIIDAWPAEGPWPCRAKELAD